MKRPILRYTLSAVLTCLMAVQALYAGPGPSKRKDKSRQSTILSTVNIDSSWEISSSDLYQLSGITPVSASGNDYVFAVVTDKAYGGGIFFLSVIIEDDGTVRASGLAPLPGTISTKVMRDPEGIVRIGDCFWVSGEADQRILEYDGLGEPTGREIKVPEFFSTRSIMPNEGFEALASSGTTIYTTTENSIREDRSSQSEAPLLRIASFDTGSGEMISQWRYVMDKPKYPSHEAGSTYVHGVSDMVCLPDGRLVVMEREVYVNLRKLKASSIVKLYAVTPGAASDGEMLQKTLLDSFTTGIKGLKVTLANYEGMCWSVLPDGSPAILLVNDSQGRMTRSKGPFKVSLEDFIRIVRL